MATSAELESIVGKPVSAGQGGLGDQVSSGIVLPKVTVGTCSWPVPAYPLLSLYVMREITPTPADARTEFDAQRGQMQIGSAPAHLPGYGDAVVLDTDAHGDVTIIFVKGPEVVTVEVNSSPPPSASSRMIMARAVARLLEPRI